MNRRFLVQFSSVLVLVFSSQLYAQSASAAGTLWSFPESAPKAKNSEYWKQPSLYRLAELDVAGMKAALATAPPEYSILKSGDLTLQIPDPSGKLVEFKLHQTSTMEQGLADQYPEIRTFAGVPADGSGGTIYADITPHGFHASIIGPQGTWYVDPLLRNDDTLYAVYSRQNAGIKEDWQCWTDSQSSDTAAIQNRSAETRVSNGTTLKTYRLACAATGEYTAFFGGTVVNGQAAIVTAINRVNQIYEKDLAVRMVLVANNSLLVYTDGTSDPYNNNSGSTMLSQNQNNINSVIGTANYDIGHVFSTGGGGIAGLAVVCTASKARGVTGLPTPVGDAFYIDYVCHEIGHQFAGDHTFNSSQGACGGNRNTSTAYEPGAGSTIMSYAGICGVDDLQPNSDAYFHGASLVQMLSFINSTGGSCAVGTATGNTAPTVDAGATYSIPINTPFTMNASGSDPNGDTITYCWEEIDLGVSQLLSSPDNGSSPIFRSFNPTTDPSRTFPKLSDIISNTVSTGEKYPATGRTALKMRVTARDNQSGGSGISTDDTSLAVVSTSGPFQVTAPNSNVTLTNSTTVTWNVANTTAAPISTSQVNIRLSTDGGQTFPTVLLANTPNDGSENVSLPALDTTTARIKVEAVGNVYWDMSNSNFTISNVTTAASNWNLY